MADVEGLRESLIFVADARAVGSDPRALRTACRRGLLMRVRRGVYVGSDLWSTIDDRERHLLATLAVVREVAPPFLVAGGSAGALWELPFCSRWPEDVTLLTTNSKRGTSEPGVRRTAASASAAVGVEKEGIPTTGLARTALDMARTTDFRHAVAILDSALWRRRPDRTERAELDEVLLSAAYARGSGHLRRALAFASDLSDSPYESMTRAVIHELGFAAPELQVPFVDHLGEIRPDFVWRDAGVAAEFDGRVKYTRAEFTHGDPSAVVFAEKQREDRLRHFVPRVVRILAEHVHNPRVLARMLETAGVPRERPTSAASAPRAPGRLAPLLEQWPTMGPR